MSDFPADLTVLQAELLTGFLTARYDGTELAELPIETAGDKEFISFVYKS